MTFKKFLDDFEEGTVSSDIAGTGTGFEKKIRKQKLPKEIEDEITESPVGSRGRTTQKDAEAYVTDAHRAEFRKIVKKIGGKAVAKHLLNTLNAMPKSKFASITEASEDELSESTEDQASLALSIAADECSRHIDILGSFEERGVMTRDAGFEMDYKNSTFQVTVVQTR